MSAFADPKLGSATAQKPPTITLPLILQLLTTISYVDNYVDPLPFLPDSGPVVGRLIFAAKWAVTHGVYAFGSTVGWLAGYRRWVREYTPEEYWEVAERGPIPKGAVKAD
jgi:hypothetical protein